MDEAPYIYCASSNLLGEGPLWSEQAKALYWVDIGRGTVQRRAEYDSSTQTWKIGGYPSCLAELEDGGLAVATETGIHQLDRARGVCMPLCGRSNVHRGMRFNDGKVDPRGRLWVTTMVNNFATADIPFAGTSRGTLCFFDTRGCQHLIMSDLGVPNTLAWSPDEKHFYFADSSTGCMYLYDFDADSGRIRNQRVFFNSSEFGIPDGSAVDVDGCIWNARWDAAAVLRLTPLGKVDRVLRLPVPRPTSCCFGGKDLKTLFITSGRIGLSPAQLKEYPHSGSVFAVEGAGCGMPIPPYEFNDRPIA